MTIPQLSVQLMALGSQNPGVFQSQLAAAAARHIQSQQQQQQQRQQQPPHSPPPSLLPNPPAPLPPLPQSADLQAIQQV